MIHIDNKYKLKVDGHVLMKLNKAMIKNLVLKTFIKIYSPVIEQEKYSSGSQY